jgi:hypothetical protein
MRNFYHILYKAPAFESYSMEIEYEKLVQNLYNEGLVRIDADSETNFIKYTDHSILDSLFFTKKELNNTNLIIRTRQLISQAYNQKFTSKSLSGQIDKVLEIMQNKLQKISNISEEKEIMLIRLLVQSIHPIVIKWILIEKVQIFLSYGHSIGDVMDIKNWKISGSNSGMQSTDGKTACVFVSCGGDPFKETYNPMYGDGWPAVARLQIIAGQELGHYSDIIRDNNGRQIGRHSANFSCTRAKHNVLIARRDDVINCRNLKQILLSKGLNNLINYDRNRKFYKLNKVSGLRVIYNLLLQYLYKKLVIFRSYNLGLVFVKLYKKEQYLGLIIDAIFDDMSFNLSPVADVYKKEDKEEEEAIACIEALARIPQQVNKWGRIATKTLMSSLYKIYYMEVIPDLINKYEILTGNKYKRNFDKPRFSIFKKLKYIFLKNKYKLPPREI